MSTEPPEIDPRWPEDVKERWKTAHATALANAAAIQARIGDQRLEQWTIRINEIVKRSNLSVRSKLRALRVIADEQTSFAKGNVACRKGCSHCCHTPIALNPVEAKMVGDDIGREPRHLQLGIPKFDRYGALAGVDWGYHNPCAFLKDGACSIYEHRPLVCRIHFNLDRDELLCKLVGQHYHSVPFMDMQQYHLAYIQICGVGLADIREYFPREP